jgi:hypothetical protein
MENQNVNTRILLSKNFQASKKFGDDVVAGAICLDTLEDPAVQALVYQYNGKRYLNLKVVKRKEATRFAKTHYVEVDTFVPAKKA